MYCSVYVVFMLLFGLFGCGFCCVVLFGSLVGLSFDLAVVIE